jgi:hypothetical protein
LPGKLSTSDLGDEVASGSAEGENDFEALLRMGANEDSKIVCELDWALSAIVKS